MTADHEPTAAILAARRAWLAEIDRVFTDPTLRRIAPNHIMGHGAPQTELRRLHKEYQAALKRAAK